MVIDRTIFERCQPFAEKTTHFRCAVKRDEFLAG